MVAMNCSTVGLRTSGKSLFGSPFSSTVLFEIRGVDGDVDRRQDEELLGRGEDLFEWLLQRFDLFRLIDDLGKEVDIDLADRVPAGRVEHQAERLVDEHRGIGEIPIGSQSLRLGHGVVRPVPGGLFPVLVGLLRNRFGDGGRTHRVRR